MPPETMSEEPKNLFRYRILRYMPNLLRDEWVNIGVLLEETSPERPAPRLAMRLAMRLIEEPGEFARVRRLHPDADEDYLRGLVRNLTRGCAGRPRRWPLTCRSSNRIFRICCSSAR